MILGRASARSGEAPGVPRPGVSASGERSEKARKVFTLRPSELLEGRCGELERLDVQALEEHLKVQG